MRRGIKDGIGFLEAEFDIAKTKELLPDPTDFGSGKYLTGGDNQIPDPDVFNNESIWTASEMPKQLLEL
ncbi:MAG: hypothetical protein LBJ25_02285 [Candidatus Margulisbacteria bacterium]|nr:hypothetical protein [Candidatus Margulisiibacteriota bacterium]